MSKVTQWIEKRHELGIHHCFSKCRAASTRAFQSNATHCMHGTQWVK